MRKAGGNAGFFVWGIASTSAVVVLFFAGWRSRFERPESLSGFARMKYPAT
jgi:hypothetical protein